MSATAVTRNGAGRGTDHVAVLTDGRQDPGLATLINSLVRNGFDGTLWVGWRDRGADLFRDLPVDVAEAVNPRTVELATRRPLACYKADFLELVWTMAEDATSLIYMDCDLILGCEWAFIRAWVANGVAIVEDLPHRSVSADHPLRQAWKTVLAQAGLPSERELNRYFNSGFVGIPASCRSLLPAWRSLSQLLEGQTDLREDRPTPHYFAGEATPASELYLPDHARTLMKKYFLEDQDALNMALMATSVPLSPMGPDAMGFTDARTPIVVHALGPHKPWSKPYLRHLLRHGCGPSFADDMWWQYSAQPLRAQPGRANRHRHWSYRTAKLLRRYL